MGKFLTFIIGAVIGLVAGGLLTFYLFVGAPQAVQKPGAPIQPPDAGDTPPSTAQIVLKQEFFNSILQTIFNDMNSPAFPLRLASAEPQKESGELKFGLLQQQQPNECDGKIRLLAEGSGVKTAVNFENNTIKAPLAFTGSTNIPFAGCVKFSGWSQAQLELRFDKQQQKVFGVINVETVNLDGVSPVVSGFITPLVQSSFNQNVNPIEILDGKKINVQIPIAATSGTLQANIQDVRAEVQDKALNLFVSYDVSGSKNIQQ